MLGRSHAVLGGTATAVVLFTNGFNLIESPVPFTVGMVIGTLAGLLPDIDSANAKIRTTFGVGRQQARRELRRWRSKGILERILDFFQWIIAAFLNVVDRLLPHRGITHWGLTALVLTGVLVYICNTQGLTAAIWLSFGAGYFSHLLGDGVTRAGVPFWAPFYQRSVRFLPRNLCIRTGSWQEGLMLTVILLAISAYFVVAVDWI